MKLSPKAEEVATFFAKMLDHEYTTKDIFRKNFFKDWRKVRHHGSVGFTLGLKLVSSFPPARSSSVVTVASKGVANALSLLGTSITSCYSNCSVHLIGTGSCLCLPVWSLVPFLEPSNTNCAGLKLSRKKRR